MVAYSGSMDAAKQIYLSQGIRGIFKGTNITLLRESFTYGIYFWTYESLMRKMLMPGQNRKELSSGKMVLAGAISGYAYWIFGFPIDLIKTKVQSDSFTNPQFKSIMDCIGQTYRAGGMRGFFRGLLPCMLRAGPVNAGNFVIYENVMKYLTTKTH